MITAWTIYEAGVTRAGASGKSGAAKNKPVRYVYIVEYPNAGVTDRKMHRNAIADKLPFKMQQGKQRKLIDVFEVLSISEWNGHAEYAAFPLTPVRQGAAS